MGTLRRAQVQFMYARMAIKRNVIFKFEFADYLPRNIVQHHSADGQFLLGVGGGITFLTLSKVVGLI